MTTRAARDPALDGLRGVLIMTMMTNHLLLWPLAHLTGWYGVTYQTFGYVSTAEGFFFLSGLVGGIAYTRIARREGDAAVGRRLLRRSGMLYAVNLALATLVTFVVAAYDHSAPWLTFLSDEHQRLGWRSALELPVFVNVPWLCDILPVYVLLLPLGWVLLKLEKRRLLPASAALMLALWTFGQLWPQAALGRALEAHWPGHRFLVLGWFEVASWQLLFCGAFAVGILRANDRLPPWLARPPRALVAACAAVAAVFLVQRHTARPLDPELVKAWTQVQPLAPLRLLNFVCLAVLIRAAWPRLERALAWGPLPMLGRASLRIFVLHIALVYGYATFVGADVPTPKPLLVLLLGAAWAAAYGVASLKMKYTAPTRQSPAQT